MRAAFSWSQILWSKLPSSKLRAFRNQSIHFAAQNGIGALSFAFFDPEEARNWVSDYYSTLAADGVPIGDAVNANLACVTSFMCHPDAATAAMLEEKATA